MSEMRPLAGDLLRARRERLGLSQRTAARTCGIPQSMLSRIESGETQPTIGTLRRVLNGLGVDLHLEARPPGSPAGDRREKQRSLWLALAVAGELAHDPDRVVTIAHANIARWRHVHSRRPEILAALDRWQDILEGDVEGIVGVLVGQGEEAEDLRQNAPFAGVLAPEQREEVLASFRNDWARRHHTDQAPRVSAAGPGR